MSRIERFEDLKAWQAARQLTKEVYAASSKGPFARDFAFRDQIRRAAVSVMSNIAEGFESRTTKLFIDYLGRAKASAAEVRSQLYTAKDLEYIGGETFDRLSELTSSVARQIRKFSQYLESKSNTFRVREPEFNPGDPEERYEI